MELKTVKHQRKGISLKLISWIISGFVLVISTALVLSLVLIYNQNNVIKKTEEDYIVIEESSKDIQAASDYLTSEARLFVANADKKYLDNYFEEVNETRRRENAVEKIHKIAEQTSKHEQIHSNIEEAVEQSKELMKMECFAMKLVCTYQNISYEEYPEIGKVDISKVSEENWKNEALDADLGNEYVYYKEDITHHVDLALEIINTLMSTNQAKQDKNLQSLIWFQSIVIGVNIAFAISVIITLLFYILKPMNIAIESLEKNEKIHVLGSREFNFMVDAYNEAHSQNEKVKEKLTYEAEHDKLTNLYNRTGYASLYRTMRLSKALYILMDVDGFKEINDKYGHDMGDRVLIKLAETLESNFVEDNVSIFRIGGDEFAILIEEMNKSILARLEMINEQLSVSKGKTPAFSLSIGIAHGAEDDTTDTLFKKADNALYKVKQLGKSGVIYDK